MKKMIISLILACGILTMSSTTLAKEEQNLYTVSIESNEWKSFQTHEEMVNACKVNPEHLKKLGSDDLLKAVLEYPLIGDIFAYDSAKDGIDQVSRYCDALAIFLKRSDAQEVITFAKKNMKSIKKQMDAPEALINISSFVLEKLNLYMEMLPGDHYTTYVGTPGGNNVEVWVFYNDLSDTTKAYLNSYYSTAYPNATFVSTSTVRYNCHSFAWYSSAVATNIYWMPNPSYYMTDGSYSQTFSVLNATKVYYYSSSHSALMYYPVDTTNSQVISKWGEGPLMIHAISYCPFSGGVTLWH